MDILFFSFEKLEREDVNEAEVFALLIGYWELLRLDGYKAIIAGDSFLAIQWGWSGNSSHPWRITDWVEE